MREIYYLKPESLKETFVFLSQSKNKAGIVAGGTDLLAKMKRGSEPPEVLISIGALSELNYIRARDNGNLLIGAVTSLSGIESSSIIQRKFTVLSEAAGMMASPTVRGMASIGGNLCNAAPSADIVPALMVLGASVIISTIDAQKSVPVEELFQGPGRTILQAGEILTGIEIPAMPPFSGAAYLKHKRRAGADLAVAGAAVMIVFSPALSKAGAGGALIIREVKIGLAAVAPTPIRARKAESLLRGEPLNPELLAAAGKAAADECSPIDDARASAGYRKKLVEVLVPRAIGAATEKARMKAWK
jgi:aerobic carbon-monoxide dehydrogenase medium subunit